MTEDEFKKCFCVRISDKCCATCLHGWHCHDCNLHYCEHPCLLGKAMPVSGTYVCDAWEGRRI